MFQLVNLITNTLYITIIIIRRCLVQVCFVFKRTQSRLPMGRLDLARLLA